MTDNLVLLKLEATIYIRDRGLMLIPVLDLPKISGFKPFDGYVEEILPDGEKSIYYAMFQLEHFNLGNHIGQWKIVVLIPEATRSNFPPGSEIGVQVDTASRIQNIQ